MIIDNSANLKELGQCVEILYLAVGGMNLFSECDRRIRNDPEIFPDVLVLRHFIV